MSGTTAVSLAIIYTRAQDGISAPLVTVEVHLANGLPGLSIVGLPAATVKESKDRVRAALLNAAFDFPARRITINLAPAALPKEGGRFDLPIALGILAASGQLAGERLHEYEFIGELALTGELRRIRGALPAAFHARGAGRALILPHSNADEAAQVRGATIHGAQYLLEVCEHLRGTTALAAHAAQRAAPCPDTLDLRDVRGHAPAKRALEIAAARGGQRPCRAPHHTASAVALVGGGSQPRPGEISLAHHGVLFLDELPEFDRRVLEVLREPLESGCIIISRAARQAEFPARFQLVAAMNPCHCGYLDDLSGRCRCTMEQVQRYRARLSGPLLDRIDLQVEVPKLPHKAMYETVPESASSASIRARVMAARDAQSQRAGKLNQALTPREIDQFCALKPNALHLLEQAMERFGLSARGHHRILKVARTIADLAESSVIEVPHLSEALAYRRLERTLSPAGVAK